MAEPHRAGAVALLGRPNAGKSTLLNRLVGQKLAIVSPRPQTTRSRVLGIQSLPRAQILWLDTPGLHSGARPLNAALNEMVEEATADCDVAVLLVDRRAGWQPEHDRLLELARSSGRPLLLVGSKSDGARPGEPWPPARAPAQVPALAVSARSGEGLEALVEAVVARLPESPPLYPEDEVSDRPLRFLAAEWVREAAFELLGQEIPYALATEVESFQEGAELVRIRANLLVERDSQKKIVIGRGGRLVKAIGVRARRSLEELLGRRVYLELWVKVEPRWARSAKRLAALGYR